MSGGQVVFNKLLETQELTRFIARHYPEIELQSASDVAFDYQCGCAAVIAVEARAVEAVSNRAILHRRIDDVSNRLLSNQFTLLLVRVASAEPMLEVVSWLNIECGVARGCKVVLCWTTEEAAQLLGSLATEAPTSLWRNIRHGRDAAAPLTAASGDSVQASSGAPGTPFQIIREALTQTPQFLTEADVTRIANRYSSPADLLRFFAPDSVSNIPGISAKKATRLHSIIHAPFHSTAMQVTDFLPHDEVQWAGSTRPPQSVPHPLPSETGGDEQHPSTIVMDVLQRMRDAEDDED